MIVGAQFLPCAALMQQRFGMQGLIEESRAHRLVNADSLRDSALAQRRTQ